MISVQNANTQLSQPKNLNSESRTGSVILSSTYSEMTHIAVKKLTVHAVWFVRNSIRIESTDGNFGTRWKINHFYSTFHV